MYHSRTSPFNHQLSALRASAGREGFAFLMEMGTGKTKVMIDEAGSLFVEEKIDAMVVFCPKGVMRTWSREVETHLGIPAFVVEWSSTPNKAQKSRMERLVRGDYEGLGVLVVNVESFRAGRKSVDYVTRVMRALRVYLAVDESQTIKGPTARQTKNVLSLVSLAPYRRIATGSPAPNSPMDYYTQLEFIEPGCTRQRSFYGFRSRYAVLQKKTFGGRSVQVEVGYRNLEELKNIISQRSFRVRKDECLDLPEKMYTRLDLEMDDEQARVYRLMREEALAEVGGSFVSSQAAITTLIRLQQILCGYVRDDNGDTRWISDSRVDSVVRAVSSSESDTVIWVGQHTPVIPVLVRALEEEFGKYSAEMFYGGNAATRDEAARRFVEDPDCRFMVATQAAGARGNTWVNATHHVYFANTYNLEERVQSEDRSHRSGQKNSVLYTDLCVPGTTDERLTKALVNKEKISAMLMNEDPREWM